MKYQDYVINGTKDAFEAAFKYAKHVQPDKLTWEPCDLGRSVLNICQELAKCPDHAVELLEKKAMEMSEDSMDEYKKEVAQWDTVEKCYIAGKARLEKLVSYINSFPEDKLNDKVWLPFDGGRDFTMMEIMAYPFWNYQYHQGQIAYIETLYGDKEMP